MNFLKIKEYEWLRKNKDQLSKEDYQRLEELNVFHHLDTGEVEMPVMEYVNILNELSRIVGKYQNGETACKHEVVIKVYRARKKEEEGYHKKILVVRCEQCDKEDESLLEKAKNVIDLTGDNL